MGAPQGRCPGVGAPSQAPSRLLRPPPAAAPGPGPACCLPLPQGQLQVSLALCANLPLGQVGPAHVGLDQCCLPLLQSWHRCDLFCLRRSPAKGQDNTVCRPSCASCSTNKPVEASCRWCLAPDVEFQRLHVSRCRCWLAADSEWHHSPGRGGPGSQPTGAWRAGRSTADRRIKDGTGGTALPVLAW